MGPADIAIVGIVAVIVLVAVVRLVGTAKGTRDCCSGAKKGASGAAAKSYPAVEVADTDESHYPYAAELEVGGMSCEHCVSAVTNALDSLDGVWATVELAGSRAHVRSKRPVSQDACREVIESAGYRLVSYR